MKILILGGGGEVGRHIVVAAAKSDSFSQITVGERDTERAYSVADDNNDKVRALPLDIVDDPALEAALADCDAVVSCVGPYYKFGTRVLSAAIRAGRHYIDVCDDWEPTLDMLALDQQARAAGVSALTGMGASPGVSNLLAAAARAALDRVAVLHTIWGVGDLDGAQAKEEDPSSHAALEHWLLQATGTIRVYQNGATTDVKPLQEHQVMFPGIGVVRCHSLGHPEPVTLPLTFPAIRESLNLMNMPEPIVEALRQTAHELETAELDMVQAVARLEKRLGEGESLAAAFGGLRFLYAVVSDSIKGVKYAPEICALAVGEKDGRTARAGAWLDGYIPGGTSGSTGLPVAAALEMLANGEIDRRGVFAPEGGVNFERFFHRLEGYAVRPQASAGTPFLRVVVEESLLQRSGRLTEEEV
ncbi:MAG: saccharopine dehydrogenase family protein [Gammaproteobacteria bacterium]